MSPIRRHLSLSLALWVTFAPLLLTSCAGSIYPDKRILQYLNQEGFGKRYVGNAQEQNYVSIGDTITFVDTYNPEVSGTRVVDIDGTILLPEAGAVWVAGYTRAELESYLTQKLSPYFIESDVKVTIRTGGSKVYYVLGEVERPGPYPYRGDVTVFEAVLQATPREYTANMGRVKVIRADPRDPLVLAVDVAELWQSGDSTYNVQIQEYDIVYVPPTLMKVIADFVAVLTVPFLNIIATVWRTALIITNPNLFGRRGGRNTAF